MSSDGEGGRYDSEDQEREDQELAEFLETELLDCETEENTSPENKTENENFEGNKKTVYSGSFGKLPSELFPYILKYLSPEDLSACSTLCRYFKIACGEENLWRRLYCLRWGAIRVRAKGVSWKQLYFENDASEMQEFVRNSPDDFREYYILMQASKRSQAPSKLQVHDDLVVVESNLAQEITSWRRKQNMPDVYIGSHTCSGRICAFHQIGDVYLCEGTGRAHVCDENCAETFLDPDNQLPVCSISGRCFDRILTPEEEHAGEQVRSEAGPASAAEETEPLMGPGRLGRAYCVGYNCDDEEELLAAQRAMGCF